MNYGKIIYFDIANGIGCRTALFVSGCTHHCNGCFNEVTWDFSYGREFTEETEEEIVDSLKYPYVDGITILGGEPMEVTNQKRILLLLQKIKANYPNKTVWIYSGYTFEQITDKNNKRCNCNETDKILSLTDILVDGRFEIDKKNLMLRFRGSENQRIIDVKESLKNNRIVQKECYP